SGWRLMSRTRPSRTNWLSSTTRMQALGRGPGAGLFGAAWADGCVLRASLIESTEFPLNSEEDIGGETRLPARFSPSGRNTHYGIGKSLRACLKNAKKRRASSSRPSPPEEERERISKSRS